MQTYCVHLPVTDRIVSTRTHCAQLKLTYMYMHIRSCARTTQVHVHGILACQNVNLMYVLYTHGYYCATGKEKILDILLSVSNVQFML